MIRVVVAEDSPTARELIVRILQSDPEITVVGEARDGVEAVAMTQALRPDLVTMDIHMPRLDGLAATKEIMITAPTPIVIVTGSHIAREVRDTMETLRVGALEVLVKPVGVSSPHFAAESKRLVETVKAMARVKVVRHWRATDGPSRATTTATSVNDAKGRVVAIAASTGGPAALQHVLGELPADFPVPVLVVQHITSGFTIGLASWLDTVCHLKVKVAQQGEIAAPRTVYIAPDDRHLAVQGKGSIALLDTPKIGGFRPSGTVLFESVARVFGKSAVAVILTGMGDDGVIGLRAIQQAGGRIIAQDEPTSVVFGMPGAAVAEGLPQAVLSLDAMAAYLLTLV